ncbi:PC4 domain-containing protein [Trichonephila clavipes]|nr:PC4 domain-containing protein [Trichonephila clavipes]
MLERKLCIVVKRPLDRDRNSKTMKAPSSGRGDWACPKERRSTHMVMVVMIEGSHNYAVVSDFADVARIHLRRYKLDATGSLLPTKDGITVTPSVWLALVREFSAIDQAFEDGKSICVIRDCLLLSRTVIENAHSYHNATLFPTKGLYS